MGRFAVIGATKSRDRVEENHHVASVLDQPTGLLDDHLGDLDVSTGGLIEGR